MKKNGKKTLIFIVLNIALRQIYCIKSTDFCKLKKNIKCTKPFQYNCGKSNICSNSSTDCQKFVQLNRNLNAFLRLSFTFKETVSIYSFIEL